MEYNKTVTLLVTDDETLIREGICNAVNWASLGVELIGSAANGQIALQIIEDKNPDIVLTDIRMPVCSGLELIESARQKGYNTHFIILSGYDDFQYAQKAIHYGVENYLLKPAKKDELLEIILSIRQKILRSRQSYQEFSQESQMAYRGNLLLRENFFTSLANGEFHSEKEIEHAAKRAALAKLPALPCQVVIFQFSLTSQDTAFSDKDHALFKVALQSIVEDMSDDVHFEFFNRHGNNTVSLLFCKPQNTFTFVQNCLIGIKSISSSIIYVGLGAIAENFIDIAFSFRSAEDALAYSMYENGHFVFDYAKIEAKLLPPKNQNEYGHALAEQLIRKESAKIAETLEDFFTKLLYIPMPPVAYVRGMCIYLMTDVEKHCASLLPKSATAITFAPSIINKLQSLNAIKEWMQKNLLDAAETAQQYKNMRCSPIVDAAKNYIEKNTGTNIKLENVASHVHLSESHFAMLFKEHTGSTFREYILHQKLKTAKELLTSGTYSVTEIAYKLDYEDYRSFSRAFKKFYGQSPSEYQRRILKPYTEA